MNDARKALMSFFWIAFAAFLLASIPHVAYFFRSYEPNTTDAMEDIWYWIISYAIAASIDITVFLLSMTVASLQRQHKSKGLILSVWLFILALSALSWYMNDRYARHFANTGMLSATPLNIPFLNVHLPDINPLIASCFQILAVAYTWISDKIAADEAPKTVEQLEKEVSELEARKNIQARLKELNKGRVENASIDAIDSAFNVLGHIRKKVAKPVSIDDQSTPAQDENEETIEIDTGEHDAINTDSIEVNPGDQEGDQTELTSDQIELSGDDQMDKWNGYKSHSTVPIEKAAELINVTTSTIKTLRGKGTLKHAPLNKELITVASLKAYDMKRSKRNQSVRSTVQTERLKIVR